MPTVVIMMELNKLSVVQNTILGDSQYHSSRFYYHLFWVKKLSQILCAFHHMVVRSVLDTDYLAPYSKEKAK
jgi:hypothetical protein